MAHFFCEKCGLEVPQNASRCPSCGTPFAGIQCPKCFYSGSSGEFTEGCPVCGYQQSKPDPHAKFQTYQAPSAQKTRKSSRLSPQMVIMVLGLLLGVSVLFYFLFLR